jgi:HEAT repeat protein
MADDPPMERRPDQRDTGAAERRRRVVQAGHAGDADALDAARDDADPAVRAARLGALDRLGRLTVAELGRALSDPDPPVRRRAAALAARVRGTGTRSTLPMLLVQRLADPDPLVAEAAAWALGERRIATAVSALATMARQHDDARCREVAVAALGAIGDPDGLPAVLDCLADRPPVRRRAVVALAGFDGPDVERALTTCLEDHDWQVRQAAEILLGR